MSSYYNAIQGLRRSPSSYGHMKYYSQMTFEMKDNMGEGHLVRFRLIPHDYSQQESGLPDEEDQLAPWYGNLTICLVCLCVYVCPVSVVVSLILFLLQGVHCTRW